MRGPTEFQRIKKEVEAQEGFQRWVKEYAVDELYVWIKENEKNNLTNTKNLNII